MTWGQYGQSVGDDVYGQLFSSSGSKIGNEFQVNTYVTGRQEEPSIASFNNGNFVVTWDSENQDGDGEGIYGQLFEGNGNKIGSEFQVNSNTNGFQSYPSVASLDNENFIVAWENNPPGRKEISGQIFNGSASKVGNEFFATPTTTDRKSIPSVARLSNGNFVVIWTIRDPFVSIFNLGIEGQLFNSTGDKIGNEFQVTNTTMGVIASPSVASLNDGNFVVAWAIYNFTFTDSEILAQLFHDNTTNSSTSSSLSTSTSSSIRNSHPNSRQEVSSASPLSPHFLSF